jgi:hypothetical protein
VIAIITGPPSGLPLAVSSGMTAAPAGDIMSRSTGPTRKM